MQSFLERSPVFWRESARARERERERSFIDNIEKVMREWRKKEVGDDRQWRRRRSRVGRGWVGGGGFIQSKNSGRRGVYSK